MSEFKRGDILVVEDDEAIRTTLVMLLELSDFSVRTASNGLDALARVAEEMPGLILLDMRMPTMDGWEFARVFHERYQDGCDIIVMTAAEDARKRAEEVHAVGSVGKPFDADQLVEVVEKHLAA